MSAPDINPHGENFRPGPDAKAVQRRRDELVEAIAAEKVAASLRESYGAQVASYLQEAGCFAALFLPLICVGFCFLGVWIQGSTFWGIVGLLGLAGALFLLLRLVLALVARASSNRKLRALTATGTRLDALVSAFLRDFPEAPHGPQAGTEAAWDLVKHLDEKHPRPQSATVSFYHPGHPQATSTWTLLVDGKPVASGSTRQGVQVEASFSLGLHHLSVRSSKGKVLDLGCFTCASPGRHAVRILAESWDRGSLQQFADELPPPKPFRFNSDHEAKDLRTFVFLCARLPEAKWELKSGKFEAWLAEIGENALADNATLLRRSEEPDDVLELFLMTCGVWPGTAAKLKAESATPENSDFKLDVTSLGRFRPEWWLALPEDATLHARVGRWCERAWVRASACWRATYFGVPVGGIAATLGCATALVAVFLLFANADKFPGMTFKSATGYVLRYGAITGAVVGGLVGLSIGSSTPLYEASCLNADSYKKCTWGGASGLFLLCVIGTLVALPILKPNVYLTDSAIRREIPGTWRHEDKDAILTVDLRPDGTFTFTPEGKGKAALGTALLKLIGVGKLEGYWRVKGAALHLTVTKIGDDEADAFLQLVEGIVKAQGGEGLRGSTQAQITDYRDDLITLSNGWKLRRLR